ncbi:UDP-glycosyltransferase 89B2-like [Quercus robur]|uniref:UDP-glycosyltransferase 89B2-like n=1 Tax=Quercus robur TaxID=38942 RepID=UPI0021638484|nr:UDP-glycosyltransferase 89B2-like [Quercus robur]
MSTTTTTTTTTTTGAHILAYAYPASGHIIPLLDLTHQLLRRGLTVTVVVIPTNLPLLQPLLSLHPSTLHPLVLPAPEPPTPSWKSRMAKDQAMRDLHHPFLLNWFHSHISPPIAIISDFFLGWTYHLAKQLGLPRVVFSPSGAFGLSVLFSLWRDLPKNEDPEDMNFQVLLPKIPNSQIYPWRQLPNQYKNCKEGDPDWEFSKNNMLDNFASWGLVVNSFTELERVYLDHLRTELGHDRVWAVGPLLPLVDDVVGSSSRGGSSSIPCEQVMAWLNSRNDNSVVYVCFGSRTTLNTKQMDVLVSALEQSGVEFILCVRGLDERHVGVIPDGFEDRVEGRGLVIKGWAPQVAILKHRAVGAFLTHCGWNSVLEGITAGVVMLTWPMGSDQFTNARLLVDQLGVGIRVGENIENIPEPSKLAHLLVESVSATRLERVRVKELSDAALGSIKGGSSDKDLDEFVERLPRCCQN